MITLRLDAFVRSLTLPSGKWAAGKFAVTEDMRAYCWAATREGVQMVAQAEDVDLGFDRRRPTLIIVTTSEGRWEGFRAPCGCASALKYLDVQHELQRLLSSA